MFHQLRNYDESYRWLSFTVRARQFFAVIVQFPSPFRTSALPSTTCGSSYWDCGNTQLTRDRPLALLAWSTTTFPSSRPITHCVFFRLFRKFASSVIVYHRNSCF